MSTRQEGKALRRLHLLIPTFECVPGCTDCCGPIPFSAWEWEKVQDKRHATSIKCPYECKTGCSIYEQRPMMCRVFGATEDRRLLCPHGKGPEKPLTEEQLERIMKEYRSWMPKGSR